MSNDMQYKLLHIDESLNSTPNLNAICEELNIFKIVSSDFMEALESLMETSVNIITIYLQETQSHEENLLNFLDMLSSDVENENTPIVIITDFQHNEQLSENISDYNIISIFNHKNWHHQLKRLFNSLIIQSQQVSTLSNELKQSNITNVRDGLTGALNRYGAEDSFINLSSRY